MADAVVWDDFQDQIQMRAMRDRAFREELLANPTEVLNRELESAGAGADKLPSDYDVTIVDQPRNSIHIVLPPLIEGDDVDDINQLTDDCSGTRRHSVNCGPKMCNTLW